jgi:hypothetical protein
MSTALTPGQWTPTGWGAQHRVRTSDPEWTVLVCHLDRADHRSETSRINQAADEKHRCTRCTALPNLGPIVFAPIGEVRCSDGLLVVCYRDRIGDGRRWKVIGEDPVPGAYGWRDDWDVERFTAIGNVCEMASAS